MKKVKILVSCANHLHSYTAGEELELEDEIADGLGPYAEVIESTVEPTKEPEKAVKVKPAKKPKPEKAIQSLPEPEKAVEPTKEPEKATEPKKDTETSTTPE